MNRRGFLGSLVALIAVPKVAQAVTPSPASPVLSMHVLNEPDPWVTVYTTFGGELMQVRTLRHNQLWIREGETVTIANKMT